MASTTTYPSTALAKGKGHPAGGTAAQAVTQVVAWVQAHPAQAAKLPNATAVARAAGVHAYAGQYAYRQHLRSSGQRVGRGRAWAPAPRKVAATQAAAKLAAAAKAGAKAAKQAATQGQQGS